ncbi:unnamed protein product [Lampetra planeri]
MCTVESSQRPRLRLVSSNRRLLVPSYSRAAAGDPGESSAASPTRNSGDAARAAGGVFGVAERAFAAHPTAPSGTRADDGADAG